MRKWLVTACTFTQSKDSQRNRDRADECEHNQDEARDLVGDKVLRATWQPPGPRVRPERFGSSHPIRILRREKYANGELSPQECSSDC